jgi:SNF2 family DNA or RNA helicase
MAKSQIYILEALLRLRQAACHPGLVKESLKKLPSAKLETLLEQLQEVLAEGHKVLVFSQFTTLLGIVKEQLDKLNIRYEYLDGKTTKRKETVSRFQTTDDCPVFLLSLKAGGVGLNLTAADYVFILDPWWNPAVEKQAELADSIITADSSLMQTLTVEDLNLLLS